MLPNVCTNIFQYRWKIEISGTLKFPINAGYSLISNVIVFIQKLIIRTPRSAIVAICASSSPSGARKREEEEAVARKQRGKKLDASGGWCCLKCDHDEMKKKKKKRKKRSGKKREEISRALGTWERVAVEGEGNEHRGKSSEIRGT